MICKSVGTPNGGLQDFLKKIAHQQANTCTTGVGRSHISCYASAQQLLCG